ncbi:unnamed protein product [Heterosigma akashiwo]
MGNLFDRYFEITDRGSTLSTEIWGGVLTFMNMNYILILNPQILAAAGIDPEQAVLSTAVSSGVGCLLAGLLARLPVGAAPPAYLSAYFVYGLVKGQGVSLPGALTVGYVAGLLVGALAVARALAWVLRAIPVHQARHGGRAGLLVALVAMGSAGMVAGDPETILRLGDLHNWDFWLCLFGLVLLATLLFHQVRLTWFITMFALTITSWIMNRSWPTGFVCWPDPLPAPDVYLGAFPQDLTAWTAVFATVATVVFDGAGTLTALGTAGGLLNEAGRVPGSMWMFVSSALASMLAARMGCPPVLVSIESATGVAAGARTGVAACATGALFLLAGFLAPLCAAVPPMATAPPLILLGASMVSEVTSIDWNCLKDAVPSFLCIMLIPLTYSIPTGLIFGIGTGYALFVTTGEALEYLPRWAWPLLGRGRVPGRAEARGSSGPLGSQGIELHTMGSGGGLGGHPHRTAGPSLRESR